VTIATDYAFLHGGGQGSWVWDETVAALHQQTAGKFGRALALDIPGCGRKRGSSTANLDLDDVTDELLADITRAGMKDVVLVGHSQAGTMLPRLVKRQPALFRRLVYVTCSSPLPGQTVQQMMGSSRRGTSESEVGWPLDPETHPPQEQYPLMFCNDMSEAEAQRFIARLGPDMWPNCSYFATDWRYDHLGTVPATFVICLQDGILPVPWQEKFAERFMATRLVRIDAGHQVMNTRPHTLAEVLRHEAMLA
jgi:pimeloyl-ACP methyl ester carboxylesterase